MKSMSNRASAIMAIPAAAVASALVPVSAFAAESPISGPDILVPKPGEFVPALIAFLVVLFVLSKFAYPSILQMMEKREAKIQDDLDSAERDKAAAAEQLQAYRDKMAGAQRDADAIIARAKADAKTSGDKIVEDARQQADGIVERGRQTLASERRAALTSLEDSVVDLSIGAASKIIDKNLDAPAQRELVEKYLDQVGGFNAR